MGLDPKMLLNFARRCEKISDELNELLGDFSSYSRALEGYVNDEEMQQLADSSDLLQDLSMYLHS